MIIHCGRGVLLIERRFAADLEGSAEVTDRINRINAEKGVPSALDEALARWARWRDDDAFEHYWLAVDNGKAGLLPAVLPEIARRLLEQGKQDSFTDLFNHRSTPSKVITPPRMLAAAGRGDRVRRQRRCRARGEELIFARTRGGDLSRASRLLIPADR